MKGQVKELLLLLALIIVQQGAFAVAFAGDLDAGHRQSHHSGTPCEECQFLAGATTALASSVPSAGTSAVMQTPDFRRADVAVPAATAVYLSRAPPSLS
jgi:hypothetical protein